MNDEKRILKANSGNSINFISNRIYFDDDEAMPFTKKELFKSELSGDFAVANYFFSAEEIKQKIWDMAVPYEEKRVIKVNGITLFINQNGRWEFGTSESLRADPISKTEFTELIYRKCAFDARALMDIIDINNFWDKYAKPVEEDNNEPF